MIPILLFDGECNVCRKIAYWVENAARRPTGPPPVIIQEIGEDPAELAVLHPGLDIWEAYAAPHMLMPDGSVPRAGEAIAALFRLLPQTQWFASIFSLTVLGVRPFQKLLDWAYLVLADIRPLLGCESCGQPSAWVQPLLAAKNWLKGASGHPAKPAGVLHFRPLRTRIASV